MEIGFLNLKGSSTGLEIPRHNAALYSTPPYSSQGNRFAVEAAGQVNRPFKGSVGHYHFGNPLVHKVLRGKLRHYGSLAALGEIADRLADFVRLDEAFSITDAVSLAWSYRDLDPTSLRRVTLTYENYRTPAGAAVLLPTVSFFDALTAVYPIAAG